MNRLEWLAAGCGLGEKLLQTDEKNNHLDVVRRNPL